jgi:hypothetical protein
MDRHFAAAQPLDLALIDVDTDDVIADVSETGTGHEAHIAGADHGNFHQVAFAAVPLKPRV